MTLPEGPESDTCVCGSTHWHAMKGPKILWCRRCGCIRALFEDKWSVPLDRVGDIARSVSVPDEEPTKPGTPKAKREP